MEPMAFDLDELLPTKKVSKPVDLPSLSVGDLQDYIAALEAEIVRVKGAIKDKQEVAAAAAAFFKK
ncbi:DUF1192 domain-containing protein [Niveispirillum cyanobacteriorum]|uniref:DUF1192 domain-containing protein n=2 Tax=Niveispirillum cyanobacteriorum TaxID=1612173 RepID=A0A2K9NAL1_9PROT|nr:DUF1192 domain-containing protein [Niveispirillum cyanobacteriorum]